MTERTFSIIKPDAVKRHLIGAILGVLKHRDSVSLRLKWCN